MREPIWITDREAVALNQRLITLFGGLEGGARDEHLLRAALARPLNKWHYDDPRPDLYELAAAYAFAVARGHVFIDGNKRTAHAVAAIFLANNGIEHERPKTRSSRSWSVWPTAPCPRQSSPSGCGRPPHEGSPNQSA